MLPASYAEQSAYLQMLHFRGTIGLCPEYLIYLSFADAEMFLHHTLHTCSIFESYGLLNLIEKSPRKKYLVSETKQSDR